MPLARLLLVAGAALVFHVTQAEACSCARNPTAEDISARAAVIFTGRVESSTPVDQRIADTVFVVTESFKGPAAGARIRVQNWSGPSASCGAKFEPGSTYTLSAYRSDDGQRLTVNLCSIWMFLPHVRISGPLIARLRELREKR